MQQGIIKLETCPSIIAASSVVGQKEFEGPLGSCFDLHDEKGTFNMDTWEKSESEMQRMALNLALSKCRLKSEEIDLLFAGDLLNQCVSSAYGLVNFKIPFFGLFGACSTCSEGLALASLVLSGGLANRCAVVTSSHNCAAERQFRNPIEYGGQRTPTAQWTVTGSGAFILSTHPQGPFITEVLPGRAVDSNIDDPNNMGAAMAPAAVDTLQRFFSESKTSPSDYDAIITGDLGAEGSDILREFLKTDGYDITQNHNDCGLLIYDCDAQDTHAGGSGCGCSAVVLAAHLLPRMNRGELNELLFISTGALMNPSSIEQGNAIIGIAHLVHISNTNNKGLKFNGKTN